MLMMMHSMHGEIHNVDPRWRVAPCGWFCDKEQTKLKRMKFKGPDKGKRFHCVNEQELDRLIS